MTALSVAWRRGLYRASSITPMHYRELNTPIFFVKIFLDFAVDAIVDAILISLSAILMKDC